MVLPHVATNARLVVLSSPDEFAAVENEWNGLALADGTPFLTHQWLFHWWRAFGDGESFCILLRQPGGALDAGAVLRRRSSRVVSATTNAYGEQWDVIAADSESRRSIWEEIGRLRASKLALGGLRADGPSIEPATTALAASGWRLATAVEQRSPYVALPDSGEELLAGVSRNHRSDIKRRRKRLHAEGHVRLNTLTLPGLSRDLDRFFELEASGWKGRGGSAVLQDPAAHALYTSFAKAAAAAGWLRLRFLELDGVAVAADLSCALGGAEFLLKTCFDERLSRLSPGAVLRAEVLQAAIEEGSRRYDFV
jgi:CelD/BcsL family acetyltransferase involved in cellulose biosynthesis